MSNMKSSNDNLYLLISLADVLAIGNSS